MEAEKGVGGKGEGIRLHPVRGMAALGAHMNAWAALVAAAVEPNPFYEPGAVLAALMHLTGDTPFLFLFIYREETLIGFFPFVPRRAGPGGIIRSFSSYRHLHCYLATPLLHRDHMDAALGALLDWLDGAPSGAPLLRLETIAMKGPVARALLALLAARRQPHFIEERHERAFFQRAGDAQTYLARAVSAKKRKEYRRQKRRLAEMGDLTLDRFPGTGTLRDWVDAFLALEGRGWKGRDGWAFDRSLRGRAFFREFAAHFAAAGRLSFLRLQLDGRPIAMKCNLHGEGEGAFSFKIAYDEAYALLSPGVLLELENIADMEERGIAWMDSCADPDHPMIDHLWDGRREIAYICCASRRLKGRLLLALHRRRLKRIPPSHQ
jgi:CelD/BcsL family acetyltransferase involved in cellulose biosynthesis